MALTYLTLTYCFKLYEQPSTCWTAGYTRQHSILYQDMINMRPVALLLKKRVFKRDQFCCMEISSKGIQHKFRIQGLLCRPNFWHYGHFLIVSYNIKTMINHPIFARSEVFLNHPNWLRRRHSFGIQQQRILLQFHCVIKVVLESNIFFLWILSDALCVFDSTEVHFHYQFMRYKGLPSRSTDLQRHSSVLRVCMFNLYIRASYDIVLLQSTFTVFCIFPV